MRLIFDSSALIAFFKRETGWETVLELLDETDGERFIHPVNWIEAYYKIYEYSGMDAAEDMVRLMRWFGIALADVMEEDFLLRVAQIKIGYPYLSLGDSHVIALSERLSGTAVTSDRQFMKAAKITRVKLIR